MNTSVRNEKGIEFNHFVRAYQDFNGYLMSIDTIIRQYYDLFIKVCNEIDPNNNEETIAKYQLDIDYRQLLFAIKEVLLHGNLGTLVGFPLLRSALEIFITHELFNTRESSKFCYNQIAFLNKDIPSPKTIIRIIEKLNLERFFKTDSLRRLYDWQSIVIHRGYRNDDYLLWFVSERTALEDISCI
jgi:site-specific DNA-adenine methylase